MIASSLMDKKRRKSLLITSFTGMKLNKKLVHITIGLTIILCWPLFGSDSEGSFLAALVPGVNIVKVLVIGLGIVKDEATINSMSRFGNYRYYEFIAPFCCIVFGYRNTA